MKLKKFIGKGIRGYMNHEINFRESVTFLVGINGSGKTSVLKLINALTAPSYKLLESIEYSYIELSFVHDTKEYIISSTKDKDSIGISLNHVNIQEIVSTFQRTRGEYPNYVDNDMIEIETERFNRSSVCNEIRKLTSPIFLGIDRLPEDDILRMMHRVPRMHRYNTSGISSVDNSLIALQEIIYDKYRRNTALIKKQSDDLRTKIFKEALGLLTSKQVFTSPFSYGSELVNYEGRRSKFIKALQHAGIDDVEEITNDFFNKQKEYLEIITGQKSVNKIQRTEAVIGWTNSRNQMEKIDRIISLESKYQDDLKKINEQVIRFLDCVNLFFKESLKEVKIQDNGEIKVYNQYLTEDGRMRLHSSDINALSSGEKQIVALIGSLIFSVSNVRPEVMIIDEPELSLHLTWQEIFVDSILKAQPQFQFILATHSPTIISKIERRDWCEDLSRKMV